MASRDVILRLIADADSAKKGLAEAAQAAGVTVREYKRAETLQKQQAAQAKRLAAEQAAAAEQVGSSMLKMGAAITAGLGLAIKAAIDWESAFADVKKVLKDEGSFEMVEKQLRGLTQVLPVTHREIASVAAAAAQLGVADKDVAAFTKTMVMLGTTTNLSSEQAAMSIARFSNIMGTSTSQASNLGSAIVYLGNNFATTESEIVAMAMRLAGAGKQVGMTEADVLGLSAALSSVGIEAEAGGSAISKVMINLAQSVTEGGDQLERFASVAGTSAADFAAKWRTDPAAALALFIQGLGRMQAAGQDVFGTLEALGITEVRMRDALLRSAAAGDTLTSALTGANQAFAENNALAKEAQQRYDTVASQMAILRNGVYEAGISIGQALLPRLNDLIDVVQTVVDGFNALPGPVQAAVAYMLGIVGVTAVVGGGFLKMGAKVSDFRESLAKLNTPQGNMTKHLGNVLGLLGPVAAGIGIVTGLISLFAGRSEEAARAQKLNAQAADDLNEALRASKGYLDDNVLATAEKNLADKEMLDMAEKAGIAQKDLIKAYASGGSDLDAMIDRLTKIKEANRDVWTTTGFTETGTAARDLIIELEALRDAQEQMNLGEAFFGVKEPADEASGAVGEYAKAQEDAKQASDDTRKAIDELKGAFDRLNGANTDLFSAQASATLGLLSLKEAFEKNGTSIDRNTEAGAKNYKAIQSQKEEYEKLIQATYQSTGSIDAANAVYAESREKMLALGESMGISRDTMSGLLDQIFQMPADLAMNTEIIGGGKAVQTLKDLNAYAVEIADGHVQIKVDALTDEAKAQLEGLGFTVLALPDGTFQVIANTAEAETALGTVKEKADSVSEDVAFDVQAETDQAVSALAEVGAVVEQTPDSKVVKVESISDEARQKLIDLGFSLSDIPGTKDVYVWAPGAPEAQAALDAVNKAAGTLSNGEEVPVSTPGAGQSKQMLDDVTRAANGVPPSKYTNVSAPGAPTATDQMIAARRAAESVPPSKHTNITASTNEAAVWGFKRAVDSIPTTKTVTITTIGGAMGLAAGGHVQFFAHGGENHIAQYARAGDWRVWAEPETGGEWYLPDALSKRARSMEIARRMLDGWGMAMVPKYAQQYANGSMPTVVINTPESRPAVNRSYTVNASAGSTEELARVIIEKLRTHEFLFGGAR